MNANESYPSFLACIIHTEDYKKEVCHEKVTYNMI
jgi:hypothetical protein